MDLHIFMVGFYVGNIAVDEHLTGLTPSNFDTKYIGYYGILDYKEEHRTSSVFIDTIDPCDPNICFAQ